MTTRAIKKLTKVDDLKRLEEALKETKQSDKVDESDDESANFAFEPKNKFNLLEEDEENNESNIKDDDNDDDEHKNEAKNKKAKTKAKKKKSKASESSKTDDSFDFNFVSTSIKHLEEVEEDELAGFSKDEKSNSPIIQLGNLLELFHIEPKFLNSDNEMTRIFGARTVNAATNKNNNRRGVKQMFRQSLIVNKKATWPIYLNSGLSMKMIKEEKNWKYKNVVVAEFAMEHSKEYQDVQFKFLDSVESLDHNNIINVLHINPYHIDSLIQLGEVSRIHDDTAMAADLIERALFGIQNTLHSSFNFGKASNKLIKMDYNRVENRCFFIALFKHINYVGSKACYRTSFELCKLLYMLDFENDPLGVILLLDFYAIRSSQYDYLINFYETFNSTKHLNQMPNILMSTALAYFNLYRKSNDEKYLENATRLLEESLIKFPSILLELLDKCSVQPDREVEKSWIFAKVSHLSSPVALKSLVNLYASRMYSEWKIPENLEWLERTVKDILSREKDLKTKINEYKKKYYSLFSNVASNLNRHLILSDIKEIPPQLPPDHSSTATYTFDPLPPKSSIISYTRPARTQANSLGTGSRADALYAFFQSILPSFNVQDNLNRDENAARNLNDDDQAQAQANNNGRFDMNQIVNRLRNFLTSLEEHFPVEPINNNNNPNNENNNDDDDIREID